MNSLAKEILQTAENYRKVGLTPPLPVKGYFNYLENGNRLLFENEYFERRRQLAVLSLDYYLERKPEKLPLLEEVIWQVLNEFTWGLPAHLPIENGEFTLASETVIDLFAAETGETLSEINYYLGEDLHPFLQKRIAAEIDRRIFTSFESKEWSFEEKENNWSAVIGGSIGLAALFQLPKGKRQQKILKRLDKTMQSYLRGFYEDGACLEGVGYWVYGFGYYTYYAEKLKEVYQDETYLKLPKVKRIAAFPYYCSVNEEEFLPFSDAGDVALPSGLMSYCRHFYQVDIPNLKDYSPLDFDHCYRFAHLIRNLQWSKETDFHLPLKKATIFYPEAQWAITRDPEEQLFFAAKGGKNDESHNHLDVGHFIFGTPQELFFTDLGAGEYTKEYFQESTRYDYFVNNSKSHHLPEVNGYCQMPGDNGSQVVSFKDTKESLTYVLDLTKTYPKESDIKQFLRQFQLDKTLRQLTIEDTISFVKNQSYTLQESFLTTIKPQLEKNYFYYEGKKDSAKLSFETGTGTVTEVVYTSHGGTKKTAYRALIEEKGQENYQGKFVIKLF